MGIPPPHSPPYEVSEAGSELEAVAEVDSAAILEGELAADAQGGQVAAVSVGEAARRLGIGRARVYQLLEAGLLEPVGAEPLRISLDSVRRRLQVVPPAGAQLAPLSAWAVLALASGDAAFTKQVAGLLGDPDRSRARSRLKERGLLDLVPRLRERAACR